MEIILKAVSKKIGYTQVLDNINCLFWMENIWDRWIQRQWKNYATPHACWVSYPYKWND